MSKSIVSLTLVIVLLAACKKEDSVTETNMTTETGTTTEQGTTTTDMATTNAVTDTSTTTAGRTKVRVHIQGTAALIEQDDKEFPIAVVLPEIGALPDGTPAHVAYVAWSPEAEQGSVPAGVETKRDPQQGNADFRVYRLKREQVVLPSNVSANPALTIPTATAPCESGIDETTPTNVACIPRLIDILNTTPTHRAEFVRRNKPSKRVAARLELGNGTLSATVQDPCEWTISGVGANQPVSRNLASELVYEFQIPDRTVQLKVRNVDTNKVTDVVTLSPNAEGRVSIRFGNAIDVFPGHAHNIPADVVDEHFDVYYDFYERVAARPLPKRTRVCHERPFDPTIYCGPGWVQGRPKPRP